MIKTPDKISNEKTGTPVTQGMIARRLGVSQSLVAQALAGGGRMAPVTRDRIRTVAREMGYSAEKNDAARRLIARRFGKRIRRGVFSVLLSEFEGLPLESMPFFAPVLNGMEAEAATRGIELSLHLWRQEFPRLIRDGLVDGVIDFGSTKERIEWMRAHNLPAVNLGGSFLRASGTEPEVISGLGPDNKRGIWLTTQHLLALGHRRIAYIGQEPNFPTAQERLAGYRQALAEHNVRFSKSLVEATLKHPGIQDGYLAAQRLLKRGAKFMAVVCYNDTMAMGATTCLQEAGLRVPQDVSVTGFDDVSLKYNFVPSLTSVRFDRFELGQRAVALLCELGEESSPEQDERLRVLLKEQLTAMPVELVVRESTAAIGAVHKAARPAQQLCLEPTT
jgi:DNA-binding LacI/PurR family transcriptional regulator